MTIRYTNSLSLSISISGTTANVSVKLVGVDGTSCGVRHLSCPGSFRRGCRDVFVVASDHSLGHVQHLTVWHDNAGSAPGWHLSTITVRDLQTDHCYHFYANEWLSLSTVGDQGEIERELRSLGNKNRVC